MFIRKKSNSIFEIDEQRWKYSLYQTKSFKREFRKNAKETRYEPDEDSDILETYLFNDEDYPNFKWIIKRIRNRSSKLKNGIEKMKNRISKYLDMGDISGDKDDDSDDDVNFVDFWLSVWYFQSGSLFHSM